MRIILILLCSLVLFGSELHIIKKTNTDANSTLLVIGGIHGDEPGGYFAASILAEYYTIENNNLWIVPNLNQSSIQKNLRGINGDMNRKFSHIDSNDQDIDTVNAIKKLILSKEVSLVLNLHDGHGFYRKQHRNRIFNPNAWGQTCVIDQNKLSTDQPFGNLNEIALEVKNSINTKLIKNHHSFDVRNTNTQFDDEAMQHSLTYFAVTNNKPAFAIESSKNLSTLSQKVFYHLLAIEEFMKIMNISFTRNFALTEESIANLLLKYGTLTINKNISLNLVNIKKILSYIPIKSESNVFEFSHPLGTIKEKGGNFIVYIGHQEITTLRPQYFKISNHCNEKFEVLIDGKQFFKKITSHFYVNDDFIITDNNNFRVNVIGFVSENSFDDSGIKIAFDQIDKRYSLDSEYKTYRIEFYRDDEFCAMATAQFK